MRSGSSNAAAYIAASSTILLAACSGVQSALDPAGRAAQQIADLFWVMVIGGLVVWTAVVALTLYAIYSRREPHTERQAMFLIIGGGVVFPTITLTGLLIYGLALLPELVAPPPAGSLKISVIGHQWWWRVQYSAPNGELIELANELHMPVGEPVALELASADVIHSLWIPSLAGKVDMIPGRKTRLVLMPTRTGVYRGVCAEYCGSAHAMMSFDVIVSEKAEFDRWLEDQRLPAQHSSDPRAERGRTLFLANGCGACHVIRGTEARGVIGPDLTHAGSRRSIAAGTLKNNREELLRWLNKTDVTKPGVHMPAYSMLPQDDLQAIASYLESLR